MKASENVTAAAAKVKLVLFKKKKKRTASKQDVQCVHKSIDLVRGTKS